MIVETIDGVDFSWNMHLYSYLLIYIVCILFILLGLKMVWVQAEKAIQNHNEHHTDRS